MSPNDSATIIRAYYDAWTAKDFDRAASLLAGDLEVEVPVNEYPTTGSFVAALRDFLAEFWPDSLERLKQAVESDDGG